MWRHLPPQVSQNPVGNTDFLNRWMTCNKEQNQYLKKTKNKTITFFGLIASYNVHLKNTDKHNHTHTPIQTEILFRDVKSSSLTICSSVHLVQLCSKAPRIDLSSTNISYWMASKAQNACSTTPVWCRMIPMHSPRSICTYTANSTVINKKV